MVCIDKYVIMPNHIHIILRIITDSVTCHNDGRTLCAPTVSLIMKNFKEFVTKKSGFSVWQRSFYDRIIRDDDEYRAYWQYIERNPYEWESDELFTQE